MNELTFEEAGEIFSILLVECSDKCFYQIKEYLLNDDEKKSFINPNMELNIKKLFLFFFIHFIDRRAFSLLSAENKKKLMNPVGYLTIKEFINHNKENESIDKDSLVKQYLEELNLFVIKFSKFKKVVPLEGENPKDTLFWEFSKDISLSINNSVNIIYMSITNELATNFIVALRIDEIIKKV